MSFFLLSDTTNTCYFLVALLVSSMHRHTNRFSHFMSRYWCNHGHMFRDRKMVKTRT